MTTVPATTTAALRAAPPFEATLSPTDPLPLPLATEPMVIQLASLVALHVQLACVCTCTVALPPAALTATAMGVTLNRHAAASCTMLTVSLFTSIVDRRGDGSWFAATRYSTAPSPWPLLAEVMTIQFAFPDAAHVQSRVVVIPSVPAAPDAGTLGIEFATAT